MKLLQRNIDDDYFGNSSYNNFSSQGNSFSAQDNIFSPQSNFSTFPQAFRVDEIIGDTFQNSSSTTNNNVTNGGVTISGNTFNVRKDLDINEIAFKLFELMSDSNANYAGA